MVFDESGQAQLTLRCKLALIGDEAVGKTALTQMFQSRGTRFPKNYNLTSGVDVVVAPAPLTEVRALVELFIFDTGGQELFRDQSAPHLEACNAVMVVFDVSRRKTFDACASWLKAAKQHASNKDKSVAWVLVGNKCDLDDRRQVSTDDAEDWAQANGLTYFECSAMPGSMGGIYDKAFLHVAEGFHKLYEEKIAGFASAADA